MDKDKFPLSSLVKFANQFENFKDFSRWYSIGLNHGYYWHLTDNMDFKISDKISPRDMSSMAYGSNSENYGDLMITGDLEYWDDYYNINSRTGKREIKRNYVALFDASELNPESLRQVSRGFGNEIYLNKFDAKKLKLIGVYNREYARKLNNRFYKMIPQSESELYDLWEFAQKKFMGEMHDKIKKIIYESLNEKDKSNKFDIKLRCIQKQLKDELNEYNVGENYDDRWFEIRQELRRVNGYFEDGYFSANKEEYSMMMTNFLKNLNYGNENTYKRGEVVKFLSTSNRLPVYRAIGDEILFRAVSLEDWNRIKNQGYIDSDMRGAILETEGINLAQTPDTATYYLPHNSEGVILAISPKNLDLYMLSDEYIRIFEPIPIENIIKISDIMITSKVGSILIKNTEKKINDLINRLKNIDVHVDC